MIGNAEGILSKIDKPTNYELVCLWLAISSTQIPLLLPENGIKVLSTLVANIVDVEIELEKLDSDNGITKPNLRIEK